MTRDSKALPVSSPVHSDPLDAGDDMPGRWPNMSTLVQRIQLEFEEDPGLALTVEQGARFWAIDTALCERVLTGLQEAGVLVKSVDGHFRQRPVV